MFADSNKSLLFSGGCAACIWNSVVCIINILIACLVISFMQLRFQVNGVEIK
jgi:hypothetical protein